MRAAGPTRPAAQHGTWYGGDHARDSLPELPHEPSRGELPQILLCFTTMAANVSIVSLDIRREAHANP